VLKKYHTVIIFLQNILLLIVNCVKGLSVKIVFICTGNICRSAFAEHAAKMLSLKAKKSNWTYLSMGINGGTHHQIDDLSTQIAMEFGVDLTQHKSQKFDLQKIQDADFILAMDTSHLEYIKALCNGLNDKLQYFMDYPQKRYFLSSVVIDPYKGTANRYRSVYAKIFTNVQKIVALQND
jgi:protein-tyrosine phosphatase